MDKPYILLVDDEPNILNALRRLLRKENYTIITASSGKEGLEILKKQQVSLIISDQRMPEMPGVEFLHKVKELYPDTMRIILSGYTEVSAIMAAINEGEVYKFITKPWNDEEIKISIQRSLEQYNLLKENSELNTKLAIQNEKLADMVQNLEKKVEERTMDLMIKNRALLVTQNIVENLPIGVAGIDNNKNIVMGNVQIHNDFVLEPGHLLGKKYNIFPEEIVSNIDRTLETKEKMIFEYTNFEEGSKHIYIDLIPIKGKKDDGIIIITSPYHKIL